MIDKRFIEYKANSYREEPETTLLAAGPSQTMTDAGPARIELTGMATPDKTPRVGRGGVPYQAPSMSDITEPAKAMLDMGAATVKGATQGFIGLPGDIEGIGRLILGKMGVNVDETTALPTTEEVKTWLDKNLGSVGNGKNPYESIGETVAPGGQVKAAKAVAKGAKALAPKAAEMIMDVTEKTGMPVRGLGIVESGSGDALRATAQASDIGFYSAVEQAALNIKRKSGTGQAMLNDITKGENVKADEIKWIGLDDFLKGKKNVTREEVQQFIAANKVDIQEVTLGGDFKPMTDPQEAINYLAKEKGLTPEQLVDEYGYSDPNDYVTLANDVAQPAEAKFKTWTLPGGENYREILLTMPTNMSAYNDYVKTLRAKYGDGGFANLPLTDVERARLDKFYANEDTQAYKSSHWEQPNVLAHIRVNDRVDADGKKMLLVEEVQSDWHQAGRDKGYGNEPIYAPGMEGNPEGFLGVKQGVPDAPMKDTWYQLALKRVLKYAADNGYERVGLTTGSRQAERYDLSKQISSVMLYTEPGAEMGVLRALDSHGDAVIKERIKVSTLSDYIGKDAAKKLLDQSPSVNQKTGLPTELRTLNGVDLQVGGEGMKKYYDEVYPQFLAKYGKKWGAKVGETTIPTERGDVGGMPSRYQQQEPVRFVDITPEMRQGVGKGQPLFSATGLATGAGAGTMSTSQQEPK